MSPARPRNSGAQRSGFPRYRAPRRSPRRESPPSIRPTDARFRAPSGREQALHDWAYVIIFDSAARDRTGDPGKMAFSKFIGPAVGFASLAFFAAEGAARSDEFPGKYAKRGGGNSWSAVIVQNGEGKFKVSLKVSVRPSCSGDFDGDGTLQGNQIAVIDAENNCEITISRNRKGISVEEKQCLYWHGASCDFTAVMTRR